MTFSKKKIINFFSRLLRSKKRKILAVSILACALFLITIIVAQFGINQWTGKHCFTDFDCQTENSYCTKSVCKNEVCSAPVKKPNGTVCADKTWNSGTCNDGVCSTTPICELSSGDGYPKTCTGFSGPKMDGCFDNKSIQYALCNPSAGCYYSPTVKCPEGQFCRTKRDGSPECFKPSKSEMKNLSQIIATPTPKSTLISTPTTTVMPTSTPTPVPFIIVMPYAPTPTPTPLQLPSGKQTYTISGGHNSPVFTEATIDPLAVLVGDTQTMTVKINDTYSITSVEARVETDNGIETYLLSLISGTDKNGTWQGSWTVHDTHTRTYNTTFYAIDDNNESGSVDMSWSDAICNVPVGGDWNMTENCSFAGVNGVDGGNLVVGADNTLTLDAGAVFAFNSGKSITIPKGDGHFIKNTGAVLRKTNLWMADNDNDKYPASHTQVAQETAPDATYKRRNTIVNYVNESDSIGSKIDYNDSLNTIYPGTVCNGVCSENSDDGSCIPKPTPGKYGAGTCTYCNGLSTSATNMPSGADVYGDCSPSYNACDGNNRIGPDGNCNGSGACNTTGLSEACATAGICQTVGACSGGICGTISNVTIGQDPNGNCGGLDCDGGATKYYSGWSSNVCYYKADVSAANHTCDGAGACQTAAAQCPSSSQGVSAGVSRTTCKTQVGCTGTTVGSLGNVTSGSDTYSDCSGLDCDGGTTKYYSGWSSNVCYYRADVSAANHTCDGAGVCQTAAAQCPSSSQGVSAGVTRTACKTQVGCTGTTVGSLGNVTSGLDDYSDCGGYDCDGGTTKYYSGWSSNVCYYKADVSAANHTCNGGGGCTDQATVCSGSTQGASTGVTTTTCKTEVGCSGTTAGSLGNVTAGNQGLNCTATCVKCDGSGSCVNQTASEDLFGQCSVISIPASALNSASGQNCSTVCSWYTGQNGNCNGSGACSTASGYCTSIGTIYFNDGSDGCSTYTGGCGDVMSSDGYACGGNPSLWTTCYCN